MSGDKIYRSTVDSKSRIQYFDVLRGIAIIFVVSIHSTNYYNPTDGLHSPLMIFWRNFICFAVPLFIVISGYFVANKDLTTRSKRKDYYKRQLPRVLIPYIIWAVIYSIISFTNGVPIKSILFKAIIFQASVPFYFIGVIIQMYILTPKLQRIATRKGLILSAVVSLSFCIFLYFLRCYTQVKLPVFMYAGTFIPFLIFYVLGLYLGKGNAIITSVRFNVILVIAALAILFLDSYFDYQRFGDFKGATSTIRVTSLIYSFLIAVLLFNLKRAVKPNSILYKIGEVSFGIYFSHMIILNLLNERIRKIIGDSNEFLFQVILTVIILMVTTLLCHLARRINKKIAIKYLGL